MIGDDRHSVGANYNLLFVCTGNTCRSPMAAALARRELERRGWRQVEVASAGVAARPGAPASRGAVEACRAAGLDLEDHRARVVDARLVEWADVILVMSPSHAEVVDFLGGGHKVDLRADFAAGGAGEGTAVPDPFGGGSEEYRRTLAELTSLIEKTMDRLATIVQP